MKPKNISNNEEQNNKQIFHRIIQEIELETAHKTCIFSKSLSKEIKIKRTLSDIKQQINSFDPKKELIISGSRTLLHPLIKKTLEYAKQSGFQNVFIRTNDLLYKKESFSKHLSYLLEQNLFTKIILPIYSLQKEEFEEAIAIENAFSRLLRSIRNLKKNKISIRIEFIISIYNVFFSNVISFIKTFAIDEIKLIFPVPSTEETFYFPKITKKFVTEISKLKYQLKKQNIHIIEGEPVYLPLKPEDFDTDGNKIAVTKNSIKEHNFKKHQIKASIIIPTFNRKEALSFTLTSLINQTYSKEEYEIIIIDDGSTDNTEKMVQEILKKYNFTYIFWPRTKPYTFGELRNRAGPARNVGIKHANGTIIIFVDSDIIASPDFIEKHMKHHESNSNLVILGYRKWFIEGLMNFKRQDISDFKKILQNPILPDLREPYFSLYSDKIINMPAGWDHLHTNNVSVSKKNLELVGLFDANYIAWSTEDNELGYRLFKAGLTFKLDRTIVGYHIYHKPEFVNFSGFQKMAYLSKEIFYKTYLDRNLYKHYEHIFENDVSETIVLDNICSNNCSCCWGLDCKGNIEEKNDIENKLKKQLHSKNIIITGGTTNFKKQFLTILPILSSFKGNIIIKANIEIFSDKHFLKLITRVLQNLHFRVILFSNNQETYEKITRTKASFSKALLGLKNISSFSKYTDIIIPVVKQNYKELKQIIQSLSKYFQSFELYHPHQPENPAYFFASETNILELKSSVIDLKFAKPYINDCLQFAKNKHINVKANLRFFILRSLKNENVQ